MTPPPEAMAKDLAAHWEDLDGWERSVVRVTVSALEHGWALDPRFVGVLVKLWEKKGRGQA